MTTLEVTPSLPDSLAAEAREAGLLNPIELERFATAREKLAADPLPPMTPEEIQAEIDAYRAQVRRAPGT